MKYLASVSLFGMQKNFYQNKEIWRLCRDRLAGETRIVPSHSDKMRSDIRPITPESIQIIFTPKRGIQRMFQVIQKIVASESRRSHFIRFKSLFSPARFYKPREKGWNQSTAGSSYDSIQNIRTPSQGIQRYGHHKETSERNQACTLG